jgi:hypothetical protein
LLPVELSVPISANTNGWLAPNDRKSVASGFEPAWYATVQPEPELPHRSIALLSAEGADLVPAVGTLK